MQLPTSLVSLLFLHLLTAGRQGSCAPTAARLHHHEAELQTSSLGGYGVDDDINARSQTHLLPRPQEEDGEAELFTIPSRYESTVLGRRLLALSSTGVLATVFPSNTTYPRTPEDVAGGAIALPDYLASCEEPSGNPTILALKISTATKNAAAGSNVSLSLSWWDEYTKRTGREPWSQANLPRLSMLGHMEEMTREEVEEKGIEGCFTKAHPDSGLWLPGKKGAAHEGLWMRLVVQEVYWIGGFGDRNFIGWFDVDEWRRVKMEEWMVVKLPGEK